MIIRNMRKTYFTMFIISFSFMIYQFLISRQLSFLSAYYVSNITIIFALSGFAFGSAIVYKFFKKKGGIQSIMVLISFSILISLFLLSKIVFYDEYLIFVSSFIIIIIPFIFFGMYFGKVFSETKNLGKLFFVNLMGLSFATFFSGKILFYLGIINGIFLLSFILIVSSIFYKKLRKISVLCLILLIILFTQTSAFEITDEIFNTKKSLNGTIVLTKYSEFSRVDIFNLSHEKSEFILIYTGGYAPTVVYSNETYKNLEKSYRSIPYLFLKNPDVLVLGAGGGIEIAVALANNISHVTGVEINPVTINLMETEFANYSNNIYFNEKVDIYQGEGRSFVKKMDKKFDLIFIYGTDTVSSVSFTSFIPVEQYLYTKEAIIDYWNKLNEDGILYITRQNYGNSTVTGLHQILRIYSMMKIALPNIDLSKHIIFFRRVNSRDPTSIILSKKAINVSYINEIKQMEGEIIYYPHYSNYTELEQLYQNVSTSFNVNPITDNKPFFYVFTYLKDLYKNPLFISSFIIIFFVLPCFFIIYLKKIRLINKGIIFIILGMAYILLEMNIISKISLFLENPVLSVQLGLFSFLFFNGLGSYFSYKFKKKVIGICALISILSLVCIILFEYSLTNLYQLNLNLKILLSFLFIAPVSFFAGIPFPVLLSKVKKRYIIYALDGVGTVIGGFLVYIIQMIYGFSVTFIFIAIFYIILSLMILYRKLI